MVEVVVISNIIDLSDSQLSDLRESDIFGLACGGVHLGRFGELCTIHLATRKTCFIFDMMMRMMRGGDEEEDPVILLLAEIMEDASKTKIIHDCKMDADALLHLYHIVLTGIHDTQIWHAVCRGGGRINLNDTLNEYGLAIKKKNDIRDSSGNMTNPRFWTTRPLTSKMLEWASGDVSILFHLYDVQMNGTDDEILTRCKSSCEDRARSMRSAVTKKVDVSNDMMWLVIGRGGCNMKSLERRFPGIHFHRHPGGIVLYAQKDDDQILLLDDVARALMGPIIEKRRRYQQQQATRKKNIKRN